MTDHHCTTDCPHHSHNTSPEIKDQFDQAQRRVLSDLGGTDASQGSAPGAPNPGASAISGAAPTLPEKSAHYYIAANDKTVHWGFFSRSMAPLIEVESGDLVTIETLTHQANDDAERMVRGDPGAESVFYWDATKKNVDRRGAGPMDSKVGAGGGLGAHICTGPVAIKGAQPGDVLEVRILDVLPRPSGNPQYKGKTFGSNAAGWWGFHYGDTLETPQKREVITIFELDATRERNWAQAVYNFRWTPQTDPFGVTHSIMDYPGVPVDHATIEKNYNVLKGFRVPIRPHFGVMGVAPAEADLVTSVPPSYTGGNIDNWRIGKGASMYYPVSVPGALFSVGDPHASQGDAELCGTAIECSLTGVFQLVLHKKASLPGTPLAGLHYPLLETRDEWLVHGFSHANYLAELGADAQSAIFQKSSVDLAMRDAYHKMRHFLMTTQGLSEDEAISLMSVAADFGITQVVDGNWGVHAVIKKSIFPGRGS
ncbi:MAG: acetamidase [Ramlibacter sp.]|jgi:acetamidase/formamidase|nr:acetamidase [Ramlibacter sp.]